MKFRKNKANLIWLMLVFSLFLIVAAQCASPDATVEPGQTTPVALNYVTWNSEGDPWGRAEQRLFDQFEVTQSNISISRGSYVKSSRDYLLDEIPPDLMFIWPDHFTFLAVKEGLVLDITDIWVESGLSEANLVNLQNLTEYEGRHYYLPVAQGWTAVYYNKEAFARYNLGPPQTWEEFLAVCDMFLANNIKPVALAGDDPWVATLWFAYLNLRLNGPEFHTRLVQGQERYDDPRVRDVFTTWQQLLDDGYFIDDPWTVDSAQAVSMVITGDDQYQAKAGSAAMTLISSAWLADLPLKFRNELGFFRFPIIDSTVSVGEIATSVGYLIPLNTLHPKEAIQTLNYMASTETQASLITQFGAETVLLPSQDNIDQDLLTPELRQGDQVLQQADYVETLFYDTLPADMRAIFSGSLRRFLRGAEDIESLLANLENNRQKAFID